MTYIWTVTSNRHARISVVADSLTHAKEVAEAYWKDQEVAIGIQQDGAAVIEAR
jgi:hypothetical protein